MRRAYCRKAVGAAEADRPPQAMRGYWLVLGVLAVWRITHLLHAEDGPWNLSVELRRHAGHGFWGTLLDCFLCLSLWVSFPLALAIGETWGERLLLWPALSAGAILVQRLTAGGAHTPPAAYFEEPPEEVDNVMLRQEPTADDGIEAGRRHEAGD